MTHSPVRQVVSVVRSQPSQDGDGVKIKRIHDFGGGIDPFLMLDELGSDQPDEYIGGFPPHPHRGIQTLTYVIHGGLTHEDHMGHSSTINAGDAQWMHTGRGIVHSEMPLTDHKGLHAFQLWLNLAAKDKLSEATYRDVRANQMPRLEGEHATLIALGGEWRSEAPHHRITGPLDTLAGDGGVAHMIVEKNGHLLLEQSSTTLAVYVFEGELEIGEQHIPAGHLARLGNGQQLPLSSAAGAQALILYGTPHQEPIAHYGPFVMNSHEELEQALRDYRSGNLTG